MGWLGYFYYNQLISLFSVFSFLKDGMRSLFRARIEPPGPFYIAGDFLAKVIAFPGREKGVSNKPGPGKNKGE